MRGFIDNATFGRLNIDTYQRELLSQKARASIFDALEKGERLPDIELGMRGENYVEVEDKVFRLEDPVYTIDGRQRSESAMEFLREQPHKFVRLGCFVTLNTNRDWEARRFKILNVSRVRVSPNVILKNESQQHHSILTLFGLAENTPAFPLYKRVQWGQNKKVGELISATTLAMAAGFLHAHRARSMRGGFGGNLVQGLDTVASEISLEKFRANLEEFFEAYEQIWGIREISHGAAYPWIQSSFIHVMARLCSEHHDFWRRDDTDRLVVPQSIRGKLKSFNVRSPNIVMLAKANSHSTSTMLYDHLKSHINSGRQAQNRLQSRYESPAAREKRVARMMAQAQEEDNDEQTM